MKKLVLTTSTLELCHLYLHDYHCRQIFFGSAHGTGYARLVDEVTADHRLRTLVTMLEDVSEDIDTVGLPLARDKLRNMFRFAKIDVDAHNSGQRYVMDA